LVSASRFTRQLVAALLVGVLASGCDDDAVPAESAATSPQAAADAPPAPGGLGLPPPVVANKQEHFITEGPVQTTVTGKGEGPFRFTAPWHLKQIPAWQKVLAEHVGKPDLRYLEIGTYEGRSLLWMADNVLTDPSSRFVAVDIFMPEYESTFDHNVSVSGVADRITKLKGPSGDVLRDPSLGKFDIIYIDGSHKADDVLADAVLAWALLSPGGLMIFDDYGWAGRQGTPLPPELLPRMAIDLFLAAYRFEVEVVDVGYQIAVRRIVNPCDPKDYCSPVGQYQYYWRDYELRRADQTVVEITDAERGLLEAIARARPLGSFEYQIPPNIREAAPYKALVERLELKL
jgi:predicted O-methyltransferase YrrM